MTREPDIVERLRNSSGDIFPMCREAATEIERLNEHVASLQASSGYEASIAQVEIERLRSALQKIADLNDSEADEPLDDAIAIARAALERKP